MDIFAHQSTVAGALRSVEHGIAQLTAALAHRSIWVESEAGDDEEIPLARVCQAYSDINYGMEDEVTESPTYLAVIGVDAPIVALAHEVNRAKDAFRAVCTPLTRIQVRVPTKDSAQPTRTITALRALLRRIQRSDLNLLAAYRNIPILGAAPAKITYTRAFTRAVYRKSVEQILTLLLTAESAQASADRAKLDALDPRITHLAFVKSHYPNTRANVLYSRLDRRGRGRIQIQAELPLMFTRGRDPYPIVRFPVTAESTMTKRGRESKLEKAPFLQTLPVFLYKNE